MAQTAQINQTIQNASFNGRNLLSAGSTSLNVLANTDGTTLTVQSNSFFSTAASNLGAQSLATTAGAQQAFSALQLAIDVGQFLLQRELPLAVVSTLAEHERLNDTAQRLG